MRWLSIFPGLEEIHLNKDVALLPKGVAQCEGVEEVVLVTDTKKKFAELKGIKIISGVNVAFFLLCNGMRFDVLHLFHLKWATFFYAILFRIINPHAKIYIKLDADFHIKRQVSSRINRLRKPRVPDLIYAITNKFSVETSEIYDHLLALGWSGKKLFLLPNGLDAEVFEYAESQSNKIARTKTILTVGRLGAYQKNTESLIKAYGLLPLDIRNNWNLCLVGSVEPDAKEPLEQLAEEACKTGGEIKFVGLVSNREDLYKAYKRAMIFAFPSRWESSGLSLLEAYALGAYLVATPVGVAPDLITSESIGLLAEFDDDDFAKKLQKAINNVLTFDDVNREVKVYQWNVLTRKMLEKINE